MVLAISALSSIALVAGSLVLQSWRKSYRRKRLQGLELRPNCLLTRHPIAFLNGPRSLFQLFDHWNDIPVFLREHGYEVIEIEPKKGIRSLSDWNQVLNALPEKCHIITDSSLEVAAQSIAQTKHSSVVSITVVRNAFRDQVFTPVKQQRNLSASDLRPSGLPVEYFELGQMNRVEREARNFINRLSLLLLKAHNIFGSRSLRRPVDPFETGTLVGLQGWVIESKFLDLAISLAERDAMGSD